MLKKDAYGLSLWEITCKFRDTRKRVPIAHTSPQSLPRDTSSVLTRVRFCIILSEGTRSAHDSRYILSRELISFERDAFVEIFERHARCMHTTGNVLLLTLHRNRNDGTISTITRPRLAIYLRDKLYALLA